MPGDTGACGNVHILRGYRKSMFITIESAPTTVRDKGDALSLFRETFTATRIRTDLKTHAHNMIFV